MGLSSWELYLLEHGLSKDGFKENSAEGDINDTFTTFFEEIDGSNKFVPRAVMVDLEPSVIEQDGSAHEEDAQWFAGQITSRRPTALHRHNALVLSAVCSAVYKPAWCRCHSQMRVSPTV
ncbi:hypothetical protein J6590_103160 [Homalodisca vitripennis]|nr:hypothetical protein J6590_103160 [Homalodisca vitripennis]